MTPCLAIGNKLDAAHETAGRRPDVARTTQGSKGIAQPRAFLCAAPMMDHREQPSVASRRTSRALPVYVCREKNDGTPVASENTS